MVKELQEFFKVDWKDPEIAMKWYMAGWKNLEYALKWFKAGWEDPVLAMIWHNARWNNPKVAYEYFSSGFEDPWEAYYLYYSKGLKPEDIGKIKKGEKMKDFNEEVTVTTKIRYLDYVRIRTLNKKTKFKLIKLYEALLLEGLKIMEEKYERTNNE